ncbi:putative PTS system, IIA component [Pediococcus damnosus]|uniref:PTS system, IIA component n=1 Tax=Pediococcus damnosus TaxID=51663 RepID=A0AAC9FI95_9LACO|nr:putative PTS system, IIA component [Pediococcus damnosus]AMV67963.1 putative PTS system, IIA component [Pediococcus damnosus]AMV70155.1 putative PTS system, IIA component [Pediococcus damnosus]
MLNKFDEKKDEIIVFTDIMSGSVNQSIFPYVKDKGVKLITGMSLPLLMAVSLYPQNRVLTDENIRKLISEAQEQIKFMNDYKPALDDDDE